MMSYIGILLRLHKVSDSENTSVKGNTTNDYGDSYETQQQGVITENQMAWQWAETLVEFRGIPSFSFIHSFIHSIGY